MPALASCCAEHMLYGGNSMVYQPFGCQLVPDLTCPGLLHLTNLSVIAHTTVVYHWKVSEVHQPGQVWSHTG